LQNSQMELYKTARELEINQDQYKRIEGLAKSGAIAESKLVDLEYQRRRLSALEQGLHFDLAARGLSADQITAASKGKFVTEVSIRAPERESSGVKSKGFAASASDSAYEVEELKVQPGEQVQAGQILCTLARHEDLFIEGRVFKQEAPLLELATQKALPVATEFTEEPTKHWPPLAQPITLRYLGNRIDPASQTVPVYAPLTNQYREYTLEGKKYRIWRFRPGQRVRLQVPVEQMSDVFVLPIEGVVREGPEAYVFRANGDVFDRKSVHVIYEDRQNVVIANDASVNVGNFVAHNGAAQLNRILKAKASEGGGHGHDHHGHSHD
jgi:membrane fusion protein, heavy metal efflux system